MFGIIAASWADVGTLTAADTQAQSETQGQFDGNYYASLWFGTESVTRERIDAATLATASFVYTAWVNAGRPYVPGSSGGIPEVAAGVQLDVGPTPCSTCAARAWNAWSIAPRVAVASRGARRSESAPASISFDSVDRIAVS